MKFITHGDEGFFFRIFNETSQNLCDGALGGADQLRCTIIKKGEVYEQHLFTVKDKQFKGEPFLREVKAFYTDLINKDVSDPEHKLKVFDSESVYLPTKKIGKNNPRAAEIEVDNAVRQEWNRTADLALVSGIEEVKILAVKKEEIQERTSESIKCQLNNPKHSINSAKSVKMCYNKCKENG